MFISMNSGISNNQLYAVINLPPIVCEWGSQPPVGVWSSSRIKVYLQIMENSFLGGSGNFGKLTVWHCIPAELLPFPCLTAAGHCAENRVGSPRGHRATQCISLKMLSTFLNFHIKIKKVSYLHPFLISMGKVFVCLKSYLLKGFEVLKSAMQIQFR